MTSGQLHIQPHNAMEVANSNQELLSKGRKRRTTLVIAGVVILALLVAGVLYFLRPEATPMKASFVSDLSPISLESYLRGEYSPRRFNGSWVSDSEILYRSPEGLMLFNARTKRSRLLLGQDHEVLKSSFEYELSADHRYLMLAHSYQKLYRYTFLAYYHIIDLETKKGWPITDANGAPIPLQLVKWAPTDNSYVYVHMNDIYLRRTAREQSEEFRLTNTGRPGTIYNGVPDWVYEEEILSSNTALWFSPDGRHLAFATFNDSRTPVMNIPYYGSPADVMKFQYTQNVNIRYPKPGRPNPIVTLSVIDLSKVQATQPIIQLDLPPKDTLREPVLAQVKWAAPETLLAVWMNRIQNEMDIITCFMHNKKCQQIMNHKENNGWISLPEMIVSPDATQLGLILPREQDGNLGNFRHLVRVNLTNPASTRPLTAGKFTVTDLLAWDENYIYFLATPEGKPSELRINRVRARGGPIECISCQHGNPECLYLGAEFSKKYSYYTQTCAGPVVPEVHVYSKDGERVLNWERNDRLRRILEDVTLPTSEELMVPIDGGHEVHVQLFKPPNMDTSGNTKYPLLVQVYGGPDSNVVTQRYSVDWYSSFVVNESVVYAKIDGRGSGLKGDRTLFSVYRNLGTSEIFDQLNITRHLLDTMNYLDRDRTAIWGWSYGGYATGMALAQDRDNIFKCGISVAPVTDWLLYDTLYTERFMGLPTAEDNLAGYEQASLNSKVDNLRNKKYFLIHGTLDDNVHYQQSMLLAKALEMKDILFEQQSYPDEAHGLSDVRPHLYHSIIHFLRQCFKTQ